MVARLKKLGSGVADLRAEHELSLSELGAKVGCSMHTIHNIEQGRNWAALPVYLKICQALGVSKPPLT